MTGFRHKVQQLALHLAVLGIACPFLNPALKGQSQEVSNLRVVASVDPAKHVFGEIEWISRGPSGVIAVSERGSGRIRFFSPDGREAGAFGRNGEGPGEFNGMASSGWIADTLWVADRNRFGVTFIDVGRRTLLRMEKWPRRLVGPLPSGIGHAAVWSGLPRSIHSDRSILVAVAERAPTTGSGHHIARQFVLSSGMNGEVRATLGVTPARLCSPRSGLLTLDNLLCGAAYPAFSPAGGLFATIEDLPERGDGQSRTQVHLHDRTGRKVFSSTFSERPVAIPKQVRDSLAGWFKARGPQGAKAASHLRGRHLPLVSRVVVGSDSSLWALTNTRSGQRWALLDSQGRQVNVFRPPEGFTVWSVWRKGAWGVLQDTDGAETVVRVGWD